MKYKRVFLSTLIFILCFAYFSSILLNPLKNPYHIESSKLFNDDNMISPKKSQEKQQYDLNYSSIYRNTTIGYRSFQAVNFTINASGYFKYGPANYSKMAIEFSDGSSKTYNMEYINNTNKNFTYSFMPDGNTPLGFHEVRFLIYNVTGVRLNTYTTYTNFTVKTNYIANLNKRELYRGEYLNVELSVYNFSSLEFEWNTSIVSTPGATDNPYIDENIDRFRLYIGNRYDVNRYYYVKLNVTEINSGKSAVAYYRFFIINTAPTIIESSVIITPNSVLRTKSCQIEFNVSDSETSAENMLTHIKIEGPDGIIDEYENNTIANNKDGSFTKNVTFRIERPVGNYRVNITVFDGHGATATYYAYLTVINNPPEILSYQINEQPNNESISITYGEDLVFTFNVTDKEESIAYVTVALVDENDEWFNITRAYIVNLTITIRTIDLVAGIWYVYIYVTDLDGETVGHTSDYLTAPQQITIVPDVMRDFFPLISFLIGVTIGIIGGIGIAYVFKSRAKKPEDLIVPEKKISEEKPRVKEEVEKKISKKEKIRRKKKKKEKLKEKTEEVKDLPVKEDIEKETTEEEEISKEKERKVVPRRKIKRKL